MDENLSDLVLHTRVAMLRGSLETVCNAIEDLNQARVTEKLVLNGPSAVERLAGTIGAQLDKLAKVVQGADLKLQDRMNPVINAMRDTAIKAQLAETASGRKLIALEDKFLGKVLSDQASDLKSDLEDIEEKIAAAIGQRPAERDKCIKQAWLKYREALSGCHELFVEYIDLIRGVLMRDAGLDRDLCRIADTIIGTWQFSDHVWGSISIPAEDEPRGMSAAQLIRLGFPEWSVWSLPLIAREFGHVFVKKYERIDTDVARAKEAKVADEADLRSWAADVFATSVMGSAYPWAAMVLRVDPNDARDQTRVAVMLYTMELLGAMPQYTKSLPQAWQGVSAAQVALDPEQENFIRRVKSRIRLNYTRWEETNELVDKLRGAEKPVSVAKSLQVTDLRNVFVAAWQARIRLAENFIADGEAGETTAQRAVRRNRYADDLRTIAERARGTCIAVIDRSPDANAVPDASQLPPLSLSPSNTDFGLPPSQWAAQK
jgi:hypothetical protein